MPAVWLALVGGFGAVLSLHVLLIGLEKLKLSDKERRRAEELEGLLGEIALTALRRRDEEAVVRLAMDLSMRMHSRGLAERAFRQLVRTARSSKARELVEVAELNLNRRLDQEKA